MSNILQLKGAQPSKPTRYAPIFTNRMFQGIWTQRNPLRDAGSTRIEEVFYGSRGDALIDGLNTEISADLTLIRRPGCTVYNSQAFPQIDRFYEFNIFSSNSESIKVIADTALAVYDATGPNTKTTLFTKSAGAGKTFFQSVGNVLYASDGIDLFKILESPLNWTAATTYTEGQYLVDSNNNIELCVGSQTMTIIAIQVEAGVATLFFSPSTPIAAEPNVQITLAGLTTVPALNGMVLSIRQVANDFQVSATYVGPNVAYTAETGTATTGTSISGATQPTWQTVIGSITTDGTVQWINRGPTVQNWGIAAPTVPPTLTQALAPSLYPAWAASTVYAPLLALVDTNGNVQELITSGTTGATIPGWNVTLGGTTTDNTAVWKNIGPSSWAANMLYALNTVVKVTFTYFVHGTAVTVTNLFQCTTAGTSGPAAPTWVAGTGTAVNDDTVVWTNRGAGWAWVANTNVSDAPIILDSNGYEQSALTAGISGTSAPTWSEIQGALTTDNTVVWSNSGAYDAANTGAWYYAYSYQNSVADTVSTSIESLSSITQSQGYQVVVQGPGSSDPQVDSIVLWRTVQGGSVLFYLGTIPNPGANQSWTYTDTTPDALLEELIEAPIADENNPPPVGLTALTYHLGRIWGAVANSVYFSTGPFTNYGNGNEAWNPSNVFVFPESVTRLYPTINGLFVFTVSNVYLISGLGTTNSSFYSAPYLANIGLSSYDAFTVNGGIVYLYTSDNQTLSLDPSSGVSEIGFPIGDQFGPLNGTETFTPSSVQLTWHVAGSPDKGLYVSDYSGSWWRLCPTPAPETGLTWSPRAAITGGFSAVQSIETVPGTHSLLIGPGPSGGPILERNSNVYSDNGVSYGAYATFGSIVLAQPGQVAEIKFMSTDSTAAGSPLSLSVQTDEIGPSTDGYFYTLISSIPDPPKLAASVTLVSQRFYVSQNQSLVSRCRHLQVQVAFSPTDVVRNELLSLTIFGGYEQDM